MMGCSIKSHVTYTEYKTELGLILGHTYSITSATLIDIATRNRTGKIPLVRLRNPWGGGMEWTGSFSDESIQWSCVPDEAKKHIDLTFNDDGEFWMSFGDFMKHFDFLEICNLSPDCFTDEHKAGSKWNTNVLEGKWVVGASAGGCANHPETFHRNPQFRLTIDEPNESDGLCTVVVSLMQKNGRLKRNLGVEFLSIGFAIYKMSEHELARKPQNMKFFEDKISTARSPKFQNFREINHRFQLPPGHYLIVPSTFQPDQEGEFVIRIFTEGCHTFVENDELVELKGRDDTVNM